MPQTREDSTGDLNPAQAAELSLLVDLEAHWANLREAPPRPPGEGSVVRDLQGKQNAYEAFRGKLVAYNKRYKPGHVSGRLLNTPSRLGAWCRAMRDLYRRVEHDPRGHCPAHLLEMAYRWADRVSALTDQGPVSRSPPPGTIAAAVRDLGALAEWCDGRAGVPPTCPGSPTTTGSEA